MPLVITTTIGGATSNSYVTQLEATTYFEGRLNSSAWTSASSGNKDIALVTAANRLQQEIFAGSRVDTVQRLAWPRYEAYDAEGNVFDSDAIPEIVKNAQCELALFMLQSDLLADTGLEAFDHVSVGKVSVTPSKSRVAGTLPEHVRRELSAVLATPRGTLTLMRA